MLLTLTHIPISISICQQARGLGSCAVRAMYPAFHAPLRLHLHLGWLSKSR